MIIELHSLMFTPMYMDVGEFTRFDPSHIWTD